MAPTSTDISDNCPSQTSQHLSLLKILPSWPYNFGFTLFNLASFSALVVPAIILMVRNWNASAFQIGLLLSMMPATQLIQLFVGAYIERVGLHKFVIGGLVSRNIFNSLVAILPFMVGYFGTDISLYVLLATMFFLNISHSVGYAGWMTWVSWLVPESHRGRYFSIEQLMNAGGMVFISLASGLILGKAPVNEKFGVFLVMGAIIGWISIVFLCRIPRPPVPENLQKPEMFWNWIKPVIKIPAFRGLLYVCIGVTMTWTTGYFGVLYLTENLHITQDVVFYTGAAYSVASLVSAYFWGVLADRFGSKPVMSLALQMLLINTIYWFALISGFPYNSIGIIVAFLCVGVAGSTAYVIAALRYVCSSVPRELLVYASIIFNVSGQVAAAIGAIVWGQVLDLFGKVDFYAGSLHVNRFTSLYLLMIIFNVMSILLVRRLPDTEKIVSPFMVAIHGIKEVWHVLKMAMRRGI